MNGAGEPDPSGGGYKRRYRALKRRLKFLIYEQECFQEELRKAQRKLLKVSRDKSFLLDRLLQYENVDDESSDSEATASSDNSDGEMPKGAEPQSLKRAKSQSPPQSPSQSYFSKSSPRVREVGFAGEGRWQRWRSQDRAAGRKNWGCAGPLEGVGGSGPLCKPPCTSDWLPEAIEIHFQAHPPESQHNPRKRSPQLGGASSPSSSVLSLQPTSGFGLPASGTPSPYLTSLASPPYAPFPSDYLALGPEPGAPQPDTNATRSARRPPRPRKLKLPLPPASHSDCSSVVVGLPFPSPRGAPKLPPPTILSTVPHQMFSDTGEGSGEDPLDGDDELVIDIPE